MHAHLQSGSCAAGVIDDVFRPQAAAVFNIRLATDDAIGERDEDELIRSEIAVDLHALKLPVCIDERINAIHAVFMALLQRSQCEDHARLHALLLEIYGL